VNLKRNKSKDEDKKDRVKDITHEGFGNFGNFGKVDTWEAANETI
jgi:hypothetical protein